MARSYRVSLLVIQQSGDCSKAILTKSIVPTLPGNSRRASQVEGSDWYMSRPMSLKAKLMEILGVPETGESDLDFLTSRTMEGSCEWLLSRQYFQNWLNNNSEASSTVWLTGNPGSGKSMLASFAISQLTRRFSAGSCQYHFFVAAHRSKRTVSYLLRSLALQTALSNQDFCSLLLDLHENTGIIFRDQKATIVWEKLFEGILFPLNLPTPTFWVFDGLDEAESPSGLIRLLSKMHLSPRFNVLLISRATKDLSKDISEYLPTATRDTIAVNDTEADIRKYVSSLVHRSVPGDYAQDVMDDILAKASGSFLWVKLALERIRDNWYTKDDIKAALSDIPEGMEPLYERMIEAIAKQPPKPRQIASRILNWAACAFKPLKISELEEALKPEFQGFVHLEQTIEEVCANFVVVNRSMVTPIHQTAQKFLLRKVSNPDLAIGEHEGNAHAAMVCIKFISDSMTWSKIFSNVQTQHRVKPFVGAAVFEDYPFLFYSLSFWAYHVSLAPAHADYLLEAVLRFLETHCLLWINGVALTKNLRILTQAAQHLKIYATRIKSKRSNQPQTSLTLARDGELKQWANDLIHLVGRFGTNLVESPLSIYKYVVPFCPKDSIISTSFRHTSGSAFAVSGISSTSWSDCLARLTTGEDQTALKLLCKDAFFVTLVGIDGELIVWLAETCEEVRRFAHGEYVTQMASSKTSNLIATASAKSTKIWDITTGEELYTIRNERHHHTKAMAFGRDNEICLAYDDCVIRCVDMKSGKEKWQCVAKEPGVDTHNCARYMSFSPDLTQIAIVFRGRPVVVWALQALAEANFIPPRRCILLEDKVRLATDGDAWNAPEVALWHPITDHVIILYEDTKIVDWNVAEDEQTQHSHLGARAMVLSPDGNLLLTSDVHGTLSLWMVPEYRLTYKLQYEELVMDLAFSPDGTRFYDIRGTFCNVWEPDALLRPDRDQNQDEDENSSAYLTLTSEPVISTDTKPRVEITSLVSDSSGKFYCCGTEDGSVTMYDIPEGTKVKKIISHDSSVSVIKLAWSPSQRYLASADDSGRIIVKRLGPPTSGSRRWAVFPGFDIRVGEAVEHLLFSAREDFLLISCPQTTRVMNLKTKREICRALLPSGAGAVYLNHPNKPYVLVRVDTEREQQYLWPTLAQQESSPNLGPNSLPRSSPGATLDPTTLRRISQAVQCRTHWLVQETLLATGYSHRDSDNRYIELVNLNQLGKRVSAGRTSKGQRIEGLAKHVRRLIGCLHNRLVFVDREFWLCTWEIESIYRKHKRHFFLPKDWLSPAALSLIVLTTQGTLLCPRNGEVGVVQSGFKS